MNSLSENIPLENVPMLPLRGDGLPFGPDGSPSTIITLDFSGLSYATLPSFQPQKRTWISIMLRWLGIRARCWRIWWKRRGT